MSQKSVFVRVPATTANLGPGFDCLAIALDLWNEVTFTMKGTEVEVEIQGEGTGQLSVNQKNLVARAAIQLFKKHGMNPPIGLHISCVNNVPLSSGLGSSATANLAGLLGANALLGYPESQADILRMATELEGHPDNSAAALTGGLVVAITQGTEIKTYRYDLPPMKVAVVVPQVNFPTAVARAALPRVVPMGDAVYNLGRTVLVVDALRTGNYSLLAEVIDDHLHQPYRVKLIQGAGAAMMAARQAGAAGVALAGAGPGIVAFTNSDPQPLVDVMVETFRQAGVHSRGWSLSVLESGAEVR